MDKYRIYDVVNYKIVREFRPEDMVVVISDTSVVYAQPRNAEEELPDVKLVPVVHYAREITRLHGIPFKFTLLPVISHHSYDGRKKCSVRQRSDFRKS